ncbi:MAG: SgcJ/EcaC family oxidoreductase [Gemmatimonadetes bacterium]|nr:SgcJ/EcaC family oxidoreductase [Gemmatimonadota bacterium]
MELTADQKAAIADTVNALHAASWDAWRAADVDKGLSYFLNSPDTWWAEQGQVWQGYADIESAFRAATPAGLSRYNITISDSRTLVLGADAAAVLQHGVFSATDSAGTTNPEQSFVMSATWVRRDGQWKVLYRRESLPVPAADSIR